jgi:hypothetical protein
VVESRILDMAQTVDDSEITMYDSSDRYNHVSCRPDCHYWLVHHRFVHSYTGRNGYGPSLVPPA